MPASDRFLLDTDIVSVCLQGRSDKFSRSYKSARFQLRLPILKEGA